MSQMHPESWLTHVRGEIVNAEAAVAELDAKPETAEL
jgi:hypothetical protein